MTNWQQWKDLQFARGMCKIQLEAWEKRLHQDDYVLAEVEMGYQNDLHVVDGYFKEAPPCYAFLSQYDNWYWITKDQSEEVWFFEDFSSAHRYLNTLESQLLPSLEKQLEQVESELRFLGGETLTDLWIQPLRETRGLGYRFSIFWDSHLIQRRVPYLNATAILNDLQRYRDLIFKLGEAGIYLDKMEERYDAIGFKSYYIFYFIKGDETWIKEVDLIHSAVHQFHSPLSFLAEWVPTPLSKCSMS